MNNIINKLVITIICISVNIIHSFASEYQWCVNVKGCISSQTGNELQAFLWIPPTCNKVNAVIVGYHNMDEETLFDKANFRAKMERLGVAIIWVTPIMDLQWDVRKGANNIFNEMMKNLADVSGYYELENAPIIPLGHSAMATYPWNFAAWNPERTLAIVSFHGDAPRTNLCGYGGENLEWGRNRNIDGIPGLMIEGEYEWWQARVNPALAFKMMYPESCISFLCDTGRGHFDVADETADYIALFIEKAINKRIVNSENKIKLKKINPNDGWLVEGWHDDNLKRSRPAQYSKYKGDKHDAFWYFDKEISMETEKRYKNSLGKKMQYLNFMISDGRLANFKEKVHERIIENIKFSSDGITFNMTPVFTDSTRSNKSVFHAKTVPHVSRICGPVKVINDTTFRISYYCDGMYNRKKCSEIYLVAEAEGDKKYKTAVQQIRINIPFRNVEGMNQIISFPKINDVKVGTKYIELNATSNSGLLVNYYVKEGAAKIIDNRLVFTELPLRAKLPMRITVVAWQYGVAGKIRTATPVEQTFFLN